MFPIRRFVFIATAFTVSAFGQDVISARSGLVHYVEGDVSIDGQPVADHNGTFSEVKKDSELATTLGRAEVLLTPGVFLRVGENSSIRMRATALDDTKVEFVSGKSMLESDTPMKDNRVTIQFKDYAVTPVDHGLYEFISEPPSLEVYVGEADVTAGGQTVRVKAGRKLIFTAALAQERFDDKDGDSLYRWSKARSGDISVANVSAARQAYGSSGGNYAGNYDASGAGSWYFNPYYNMYTFLPGFGMAYSPFGYGFYSPYAFNQFYSPYGYGYGGGYGGYYPTSGSSSGSSGGTTKSGGTGWQHSLNHPFRPVIASPVASASRGNSGSGYTSEARGGSWAPLPASSGMLPTSNAGASAGGGHMGGGAVGGGSSTHK